MLTKFSPYSSYLRVETTTATDRQKQGSVLLLQSVYFSVFFRRVARLKFYFDQSYQRDDDLAVAAGGEGVLPGELLPDLLVVVDLSIGHDDDGPVLVVEGLVAGERGDDGEALLRQEVALALEQPGPVRSTVLQPAGAGEDAGPLGLRPVGAAEDGELAVSAE
jgi:hypothetical protein